METPSFFSIFVAMHLTLHKHECIQIGVYELYFQFARRNEKVTKINVFKQIIRHNVLCIFFLYFRTQVNSAILLSSVLDFWSSLMFVKTSTVQPFGDCFIL